MVEKIWLLYCGSLLLDQSALQFGHGYGNKISVPVFAFLVRANGEYGLIDTGQKVAGIKDPEKIWGERAKVFIPDLAEEDDIAHRLGQIGLKATDISWVIHTHLHWDHTGGNHHFPGADFYVQKKEYAYAKYPDAFYSASYMANHFGVVKHYHLIEGDKEVSSGVWAVSSPGHTPGHQSVLLHMCDGRRILVAGDAVYSQSNVDHLVPPGNAYNASQAYSSLLQLSALAKRSSALMLTTHEYAPDYPGRVNQALQAYNVQGENRVNYVIGSEGR
jgi:glyoxylase-like metal-dependent hydrolase (beta-lactamase superfamily II)